MHGRVAVLDAPVVAASEHLAVAPDQRAADRDAALGQAELRLLDRDREPVLVVVHLTSAGPGAGLVAMNSP